ncbi:amidohydrolase [Novosphingobium sp. FSY-8]|uniref:Amidohydrolase n=1 Tax=Novosphingobium ovatum TaxID=1908523 RepID=A0ABW9X9P1_9SPHN|nr:carbon-nitrogen hydrolase family protein [Novosphingobium ovatum]NBC35246.1 amidohydrolase [Novosphingobium ovatum]
MSGLLRIAAAQYPIDRLADWAAYVAKITDWVERAVADGAQLLVFPEYGAMELAALDGTGGADLAASLDSVSALLPQVDALHAALAARHGVHILAASAPCRVADASARHVNRARLFAPNGRHGHQDKQVMTRFENEAWGVSSGGPLRVFDTALGRIGIAICYDSEFPLIARAMVQAGVQLILVPSCTDTPHGYWRVRIGCQSRALESQCYVIQSPTVGDAPWSPAVDVNRGAAGVFAPPDHGMPADGVIALGVMDAAQWLYADIDLAHIATLRADGMVLNARDWAAQPGAGDLPLVEVVDLRHNEGSQPG